MFPSGPTLDARIVPVRLGDRMPGDAVALLLGEPGDRLGDVVVDALHDLDEDVVLLQGRVMLLHPAGDPEAGAAAGPAVDDPDPPAAAPSPPPGPGRAGQRIARRRPVPPQEIVADAHRGGHVARRDALDPDRLPVAVQRDQHDLARRGAGPSQVGEGRGLGIEPGGLDAQGQIAQDGPVTFVVQEPIGRR